MTAGVSRRAARSSLSRADDAPVQPPFDHPKRVYDEFIKEDYVVAPKEEENK